MTPKEMTEMVTRLLNNGWTSEDIDDGLSRLVQMRLSYQQGADSADRLLDQRRLNFVRWLYLNDKISEWFV